MDAVFVITGNTAGEVREELRCVLKKREKVGLGREKDYQASGKAEVCVLQSPVSSLCVGVPASFLKSHSC